MVAGRRRRQGPTHPGAVRAGALPAERRAAGDAIVAKDLESGQALAQAAQGSGRVPIPGGVQTPCGCGTWGHGLAGMVGLG